jgi:hypothetical protein
MLDIIVQFKFPNVLSKHGPFPKFPSIPKTNTAPLLPYRADKPSKDQRKSTAAPKQDSHNTEPSTLLQHIDPPNPQQSQQVRVLWHLLALSLFYSFSRIYHPVAGQGVENRRTIKHTVLAVSSPKAQDVGFAAQRREWAADLVLTLCYCCGRDEA